jgi:hypothetical protein
MSGFSEAIVAMNNGESYSYEDIYLLLDDEVSRVPVTVKCKGERPITVYRVGTLFDKHYVVISISADKDFNQVLDLAEIEEVIE